MKIPRELHSQLSRAKPRPYTFEIKKGKRVPFYFGANHSPDPRNKQYPILKKYWNKFLKTKNKNKTAVIEGGMRKTVPKNGAAAIRSGSEGSFIVFFAHKSGIPVICP